MNVLSVPTELIKKNIIKEDSFSSTVLLFFPTLQPASLWCKVGSAWRDVSALHPTSVAGSRKTQPAGHERPILVEEGRQGRESSTGAEWEAEL